MTVEEMFKGLEMAQEAIKKIHSLQIEALKNKYKVEPEGSEI
jgi:ribonuclease PH